MESIIQFKPKVDLHSFQVEIKNKNWSTARATLLAMISKSMLSFNSFRNLKQLEKNKFHRWLFCFIELV